MPSNQQNWITSTFFCIFYLLVHIFQSILHYQNVCRTLHHWQQNLFSLSHAFIEHMFAFSDCRGPTDKVEHFCGAGPSFFSSLVVDSCSSQQEGLCWRCIFTSRNIPKCFSWMNTGSQSMMWWRNHCALITAHWGLQMSLFDDIFFYIYIYISEPHLFFQNFHSQQEISNIR